MKKIILSIFLALSLYSANAQEKYPTYCEIFAFSASMGKCRVLVDMGEYACGVLIDENKKEIEFGSIVSAANYMVKRGWRVVSAYGMEAPVSFLGREYSPHARHYLLEKMVSSDSDYLEGLNLWYENNKARQQYESKIANK